MSLTADIRPAGQVRAFEPRHDGTHWACRGRIASVHRGTDGKPRNTRQCNRRLDESWTWCPACGGLIAWGGTANYGGRPLRHLERTAA